MLNTISWQHYLIAVILCCAAWYVYVGIRFYQPELQTLLKIKRPHPSFTPGVANAETSIIGVVGKDPDTHAYEANELIFGSPEPDEVSDQTLPKGPFDDLLLEASTLMTAYEDNEDKQGFLSLFKILLSKYEVFADEISLPAAISSLKTIAQTKLPFPLSDAEWPQSF